MTSAKPTMLHRKMAKNSQAQRQGAITHAPSAITRVHGSTFRVEAESAPLGKPVCLSRLRSFIGPSVAIFRSLTRLFLPARHAFRPHFPSGRLPVSGAFIAV
jgi:hypothetical protein